MGKPESVVDDLLKADRTRSLGNRCWVCRRPEVAAAIVEILAELDRRGECVMLVTLGEWLVKAHGYPKRPVSLGHHLKHHVEGGLWDQVHG